MVWNSKLDAWWLETCKKVWKPASETEIVCTVAKIVWSSCSLKLCDHLARFGECVAHVAVVVCLHIKLAHIRGFQAGAVNGFDQFVGANAKIGACVQWLGWDRWLECGWLIKHMGTKYLLSDQSTSLIIWKLVSDRLSDQSILLLLCKMLWDVLKILYMSLKLCIRIFMPFPSGLYTQMLFFYLFTFNSMFWNTFWFNLTLFIVYILFAISNTI